MANRTYSVPSRLIGTAVDAKVYADHIEVYYKGHLVESMERLHGTEQGQTRTRMTDIDHRSSRPGRSGWRTTHCVAGGANVPTSST